MNDTAPDPLFPTPLQAAAPLPDWGVIRAQGADAATFLQGQLTADVAGLKPGQATLAGYCSAKGRLLASFVVWRPAADEFLLACSADLLAPTLKRLSMYVLRAKCKLSDATPELPLWGAVAPAGDAAAAWTAAAANGAHAVRLPDAGGQARWLVAGPLDAPLLDAAAWRQLEVQSGVVRIVAATVDQFVPQMVNLELVGGVNFKKGCYPGQEVVARSQYRGTLKRRAVLLASPVAFTEGQEVFHDADPAQPAGLVALAAPASGEQPHLALVEVKRALAEGPGSFRLGAADGPPLAPQPLPYALPTDAE
jgi:tRNA-modifying protein YgfZ